MSQRQLAILVGAIFGAALLVVAGVLGVYLVADGRRKAEADRHEREAVQAFQKIKADFDKNGFKRSGKQVAK